MDGGGKLKTRARRVSTFSASFVLRQIALNNPGLGGWQLGNSCSCRAEVDRNAVSVSEITLHGRSAAFLPLIHVAVQTSPCDEAWA